MFKNEYDIIGSQLLVATNCSKHLNCSAVLTFKNTQQTRHLSA